jgi:hypothetical protein
VEKGSGDARFTSGEIVRVGVRRAQKRTLGAILVGVDAESKQI